MSSTKAELQSLRWRKARRSMGNGECVEVAPVSERVLIRDSMNPDGSMLQYHAEVWQSFIREAKQGHFDVLRL
jgi:hypothetical protein